MKASEIPVGHLVKNRISKRFGIACWLDCTEENKAVVFFDTNLIVPVSSCINDYEDCGEFNLKFQEKVVTTTTMTVTATVKNQGKE